MRRRIVLTAAVAFAFACGGGTSAPSGNNPPPPPPPPPPPAPAPNPPPPPGGNITEVSMTDNAFAPTPVTIQVGTSVRWTNNGYAVHTATGSGFNGIVSVGQTFTHTFSTTGTFNYVCNNHAGMSGSVSVTP